MRIEREKTSQEGLESWKEDMVAAADFGAVKGQCRNKKSA